MHASAPKFDQPFEIRLQVVTRVQLEPVLPVISGRATPWISAVREEHSLPQGPLAPVRVMLSLSIVAYYDPIRQTRRHMATSEPCSYTPCLRCAGVPRRPPSPSLSCSTVLSLRAIIRTPAGRAGYRPVANQPSTRLPQFGHESPPAFGPSLPASDGNAVDAAMFTSCYGP